MTVRTYNLPRFVRPSFVTVEIDGRKDRVETGPRARHGRLSASFALREAGGIVDDAAVVDAIASSDGTKTLFRVTVRGRVVHEETVEQ